MRERCERKRGVKKMAVLGLINWADGIITILRKNQEEQVDGKTPDLVLAIKILRCLFNQHARMCKWLDI